MTGLMLLQIVMYDHVLRFGFFSKTKKQFLHWNETDRFQRVSKIFWKFFVQNEAEDSYFINQKFFTPSLLFYPTFLTMNIIQVFEILIFTVFQDFSYEKSWGKKLVGGVKNF